MKWPNISFSSSEWKSTNKIPTCFESFLPEFWCNTIFISLFLKWNHLKMSLNSRWAIDSSESDIPMFIITIIYMYRVHIYDERRILRLSDGTRIHRYNLSCRDCRLNWSLFLFSILFHKETKSLKEFRKRINFVDGYYNGSGVGLQNGTGNNSTAELQ